MTEVQQQASVAPSTVTKVSREGAVPRPRRGRAQERRARTTVAVTGHRGAGVDGLAWATALELAGGDQRRLVATGPHTVEVRNPRHELSL